MEYLRTPEDRFSNLMDFSFQPNYLTIDDTEGGQLRLAYIDEGPRDADIVLLLHGQPVWSYLYRHMIPPLLANGLRVIAPDLIGFGRSDKPVRPEDYSYARHVTWMSDWLEQLDLTGITVFMQDWGSLIGLRLVTAFPQRFASVVLSNGGLPAGVIPSEHTDLIKAAYKTLPAVEPHELSEKFRDTSGIPGMFYWRKFCAEHPVLDIGEVVSVICPKAMTEADRAAYNAPYPENQFKAGVRRFPSLVPLLHDDAEVEANKAAWRILETFEKPFMCAFSDNDPVTAGADTVFLKRVPGCHGVKHRTISGGGHFVQQVEPEQCVQAILDIKRFANGAT